MDAGDLPIPHQGSQGALLVEACQRWAGLLTKQFAGFALAQILAVALDLALAVDPHLFHQIDHLVADDAAGEQGTGGLQQQRFAMVETIALKAVSPFRRLQLGNRIGSGGAAAVNAEQVGDEGLAIGPQCAKPGRLPVEDGAILTPARLPILIAVEADIDRFGLGVGRVDHRDLLLCRIGAEGERQMAGVGGKGEMHLVARRVEAGRHQLPLLVARQIQQMDGLAIHHEGELLAIGGEHRTADPFAGNGQQQTLGQSAGIAEQQIRITLAQAIEGGVPLLLRQIDEGAALLGEEGAGLLARISGQLAHRSRSGSTANRLPSLTRISSSASSLTSASSARVRASLVSSGALATCGVRVSWRGSLLPASRR